MCQTSIIIPYDYQIYNLVLPFSIKPIAKIFANMITRCTNYEFCTLFLQHLHSANYSYYRERLEEKETVFFGRSRLYGSGHIMNLIAHALGAYYGQSARRISAPSGRACKFHEEHAVHLLLFPFRSRVISICGCVTLAAANAMQNTPPRDAPRTKEEPQERNKGDAHICTCSAVDIARRESFISHSRAMRLMGNGACFSRHAECTRRKKSSMSARS